MHTAITAPANRPTMTAPDTADVGMHCAGCLDTLAPDGHCLNVGACRTADKHATRLAPGETMKTRRAPRAFTIRGGVD